MNASASKQASATPTKPTAIASFSSEEEAALRESLKRCAPEVIESAIEYRTTGDVSKLPSVINGLLERFLDPDLRAKLNEKNNGDLRFIEDLGIDSLTMMEIIMLVEETVKMEISNNELRHLRTLGDIKIFIDCKARGVPPPQPPTFYPIETIVEIIPISAPFLFLQEAEVSSTSASGKYKITGDEFFLQGHFKNNPVMPASIMVEAVGQLAVFYLLTGLQTEAEKVVGANTLYFTSSNGVRCHRVCKPGDTLSLNIKLKRTKMPLAVFEGSIRVGQEKAVSVEEFTLTYGLIDRPSPPDTNLEPSPSADLPLSTTNGPVS